MSKSESGQGRGALFFELLFLLFLGLKLTGHIDWSWWWVTAPLWGPLLVMSPVFAVAAVLWYQDRAKWAKWESQLRAKKVKP